MEPFEYYEERWNWKLKGGAVSPATYGTSIVISQSLRAMCECVATQQQGKVGVNHVSYYQ